jgi:cytoplasmic tRNA 2-thiolation protein 2
MTRLTERTLAETSKGRGFALPQILGQTASLHGIPCTYPLRDTLRTELEQYVQHRAPELRQFLADTSTATSGDGTRKVPVSSSNLSIDQLIVQYVAGVEHQYPNMVNNVVRTGAKLIEKDSEQPDRCPICGFLLDSHDTQRQENMDSQPSSLICHGCARSLAERTK